MTPAIRWKTFAFAAVAINLIAFLMVRMAPRRISSLALSIDDRDGFQRALQR